MKTKHLHVEIQKSASGEYDGTWVVSSTSPDRVDDTFSEKALQQLANKTRKMVGIQITDKESDDGALKLSRRRRSVSVKAPQFFDLYGISFEEAQRFDVGQDPTTKILTISLKNVPRRRGRRPKKI